MRDKKKTAPPAVQKPATQSQSHSHVSNGSQNRPSVQIQRVEQQIEFSGPLPSPQVLKAYDLVKDGYAERIMIAFEKQYTHRMELESIVIRGDSIRAYLGIAAAFIIAMSTIVFGWDLSRHGYQVVGGGSILLGIGGLVAAFMGGQKVRSAERITKYEESHDK